MLNINFKKRLIKQIEFIVQIDKLKQVFRQTLLTDGLRKENDAEHSWHAAIMALLLSEYANFAELDVSRVIKLILVHDLVEIDAGDVYCYDQDVNQDRVKKYEKDAAVRLFNILPEDQAQEILSLWEEFEEWLSPEARFAASLDRLQPLLHDYYTKGIVWDKNHVKSKQVMARNKAIADGSTILWEYAKEIIECIS
ncbi:HD domain-containing protein [Candidatus Formimonas warabiya]|uniref:HD domain-containing protein n=1 Tax=Formimonas warabiya TaxID=1761012 RepID=A0A3G1KYZ7_FORW1|nr:HD domain-containing protein [Candidatus Formimonas warabiya]ATW27681.1 hypothetical protein DCMF_25610 [Candidatus Formimonas warabiya]